MEVDGHLLTRATKDQAEGQQLELKAKGQFLYEERVVDRFVRRGPALLRTGRGRDRRRPSAESVGLARRSSFYRRRREVNEGGFRSLQGALTREELELIELPGGSQWVDHLLPGRDVKVGETWTHDDQLIAQLLNLSAVTINEVNSELKAIDEEQHVAQLTLSGKTLGYVAGVLTEIQLQGKYNFDLQKQRVTWLALGIQEQRAAGLTKPGLQVEARVRMLIEEAEPQHLTSRDLAGGRAWGAGTDGTAGIPATARSLYLDARSSLARAVSTS